jgi:hypothetical protein
MDVAELFALLPCSAGVVLDARFDVLDLDEATDSVRRRGHQRVELLAVA